jgi:hypothetical protein
MDTPTAATRYKNHRFPAEIISHAVWLYFRFCLSFRDVEELLLERGVVIESESKRGLDIEKGRKEQAELRCVAGTESRCNSLPFQSMCEIIGSIEDSR